MSNPLISLENVRLTLPSRAGAVEILRGADLSVKAGDAIGIVGPSGSGKTTLLMVIAGLERVSSGKIAVAGTYLNGQSEDALTAFRRDTIGIVFQSFHLIPTMTALENVAVPLEFKGRSDSMETAPRAIGARRPRPSPRSLSRPIVGRRAAARRHCPRHGLGRAHPAWPTSRPAISIRKPASRSWICSSR